MSVVDISFAVAALLVLLVGLGHLFRLLSTWNAAKLAVSPTRDPEVIALLDRKVHLLEDLRDLELDYQMGKIPEQAYHQDKKRLEPEAIAVLKELEARGLGPKDDEAMFEDMDDEDWDDAL